MNFSITVLGSNSGMPAQGRHPSAQVVQISGHQFLVDCGEGTQLQMARYHIRRNRIEHIFISHLHGDHVFGLAGLITSLNHRGYNAILTIHGTVGIKEMILNQLRLSGSILEFELAFREYNLSDMELILDLKGVEVYSFPLQHRIQTIGFLFREKMRERPLLMEEARRYNVDQAFFAQLKKGYDIQTADGRFIDHRWVTLAPLPTRSFAYCSDTIYHEELTNYIHGVDLLYHEATFMHDLLDKAIQTQHSTARQAAQMALLSEVGYLLIGHYSSRYHHLDALEEEARTLFADTKAVIEGYSYTLDRSKKIIVEPIK